MDKKQLNDHIDSIKGAIVDYEKESNEMTRSELKEYVLERFSDLEMEYLRGIDDLNHKQAQELKDIIDFLHLFNARKINNG
jgi:hypothetical protein